MSKQLQKICLLLLVCGGFVALSMRESSRAPAAQWLTSMPEALQKAKAETKPILIDFQADWCGPCHMMNDEVLTKGPFLEQASRWVLLRIDNDTQQDIAARYGASSLPTLLALRSDGKPVFGSRGYRGPEYTMAFVNEAFQKATTPPASDSHASNK